MERRCDWLAFLPQPISVAIAAALIGPRLNRRFGPKVIIPSSFILGCLGALVLAMVTPATSYVMTIMSGLVPLGLSGGLFFPTANALATSSVRPEEIGVTSAMVSTSQQVGGTLGVAILNAVAGRLVQDLQRLRKLRQAPRGTCRRHRAPGDHVAGYA